MDVGKRAGELAVQNSIKAHEPVLTASSATETPAVGLYGETLHGVSVGPTDAGLMLLQTGCLTIGSALVACVLVAGTARRLLGGYTGDVLGAVAVLTDCFVLAGLTTLL